MCNTILGLYHTMLGIGTLLLSSCQCYIFSETARSVNSQAQGYLNVLYDSHVFVAVDEALYFSWVPLVNCCERCSNSYTPM